jgi:hypothetical protein
MACALLSAMHIDVVCEVTLPRYGAFSFMVASLPESTLYYILIRTLDERLIDEESATIDSSAAILLKNFYTELRNLACDIMNVDPYTINVVNKHNDFRPPWGMGLLFDDTLSDDTVATNAALYTDIQNAGEEHVDSCETTADDDIDAVVTFSEMARRVPNPLREKSLRRLLIKASLH